MGRGDAMSLQNLQAFGLHARLATMRFGWVNSMGCILIASGIATWMWGIPYLREQTNAPMRELQRAQQSLQQADGQSAASPALPQERLATFYDMLGDKRYVEQQVKTLFAIAAKSGLTLDEGEYKSGADKDSRSTTYQVILPVRGQYQSIRTFCEQTLLAIPFASLDEINFKREGIANSTLEAKLHFTFYLTDPSAPTRQATTSSSSPLDQGGRS
jgi:hypothetical protein